MYMILFSRNGMKEDACMYYDLLVNISDLVLFQPSINYQYASKVQGFLFYNVIFKIAELI